MDKKIIKDLKEKLEKDKENIEQQLKKFASKDKHLKDDWDTRFPSFNGKESGGSALEQAAGEVEEYGNLLPVEHSLELRLRDIKTALEKIKQNKFGFCEKCRGKVSVERLKALPEAKTCKKCQN